MGLKKCKDCDHEISTSAQTCPNCGRRLTSSTVKVIGIIVIALIVLTIFGIMVSEAASCYMV